MNKKQNIRLQLKIKKNTIRLCENVCEFSQWATQYLTTYLITISIFYNCIHFNYDNDWIQLKIELLFYKTQNQTHFNRTNLAVGDKSE